MGWTIFFFFVVLKIPVLAALYILWWAVRQEVEPVTDQEDEDDPGPGRGGSARPRKPRPRPPRRGPHEGPRPRAPQRSRKPALARTLVRR